MKKKKTAKKQVTTNSCPVTFCMTMIGGKWKPILLFRISAGMNRFGILLKSIDGVNRQMLSKQLKELEKSGIIERKVFPEIPPRVEYSLTVLGKSLMPIIQSMNRWGKKHQTKEPESTSDMSAQLPLFDL